jgi:phosphate transport system protein
MVDRQDHRRRPRFTLRELLTHMMEDPRDIVFCAHLLFCSKNLERMGDHVTNIADSVYYMFTGNRLNGDRPRRRRI